MNAPKKGLGRGLSALFGDDDVIENAITGAATRTDVNLDSQGSAQTKIVPLSSLEACAFQPRRHFDNASIAELAESLKAHGVLQPLLVRPHPKRAGAYEIVAGERRWRAAQRAKLHELPVVVRAFNDREVLEIGLIENLQRENLQPLDEAETYKKLIEEHAYTQDTLAGIIGKSRSHIANTMRLLVLPDGVRALLLTGKLSAGHARALIGAVDAEALAKRVVQENLSVRAVEQLVSKPHAPKAKAPPAKSANTKALEANLAQKLGWKVAIDAKKNGSGKIVIPYKTLDDLDALLSRLGR